MPLFEVVFWGAGSMAVPEAKPYEPYEPNWSKDEWLGFGGFAFGQTTAGDPVIELATSGSTQYRHKNAGFLQGSTGSNPLGLWDVKQRCLPMPFACFDAHRSDCTLLSPLASEVPRVSVGRVGIKPNGSNTSCLLNSFRTIT